MALSQAKLELVFQGPPTVVESEVIDILATRFNDFFLDSTVALAPVVPAALIASNAEVNFRAAAVGLSQTGQSAAKVQAAISAYWAAVLAVAPTIWLPTPLIAPASALPPPTLGGVSAALSSVFATNLSTDADLATASANAAAAVMPTQVGGAVTLLPPPPSGTPGVPIL